MDGTVTDAFLATAGNCVQAQNKLFGSFNIADLPAGGSVVFSLVSVGGQDFHEIAFNNSYGVATYTLGFEVEVTGPGLAISALDGDFTQTDGTSVLLKNSDPTGTPATGIALTKIGPNPEQPGSITKIDLRPA